MAESSTNHPIGDQEWTEDPRYAISRKELVVTIVYFAVYTVAMIGLAWLLGGNDSLRDVHYVLGFPAWFFWSTLVLGGVFCIVPYFVVKAFFTDVSLEADPDSDPAHGRDDETLR